jgi:Zn-dependent protease
MRFPRFDFQSATLDVGRFGPAPIALHASFFIAAFALTLQFWKRYSLEGLALTLIGIVILFASVLVHELAHAVFARRYNIPVSRIDIHALGGTVHFGWWPARVAQDLALTFAGPASNLVLAAFCGVALLFVLEPHMVKAGCEMVEDGFKPANTIFSRALVFAMWINLGLGLINLLPAFPLDGGWISYRLLTHRFGVRRAGIVVASLGILFATISTLVLLCSMLAGMAIYAPPDFHSISMRFALPAKAMRSRSSPLLDCTGLDDRNRPFGLDHLLEPKACGLEKACVLHLGPLQTAGDGEHDHVDALDLRRLVARRHQCLGKQQLAIR